MINQRLDEWKQNHDDDYYDRQFKSPYRSTIKFCDWMEEIGVLDKRSQYNILDIGTGKGANIYYMQQRFPNCQFTGLDINAELVQYCNTRCKAENVCNCKTEHGDLYNPNLEKYADRFEGITCYQTLSWLPEYEIALKSMLKLNPDWISLTSLFYEGLIDCKIEVQSYRNHQEKNSFRTISYNIYSLPRMENFFFEHGYKVFKYCPFEIDIDISKT